MIDNQDYIAELCYNIQEKDCVKAEVILSHFQHVDDSTRYRVVFELSRADDDFSIPLLERLITDHPVIIDAIPALRQVFISKIIDHPVILSDFVKSKLIFENFNLYRVYLDLLMEIEDPQVVEIHNRALYSTDVKVRNHAGSNLVKIGTKAISAVAENLKSDNPDLVVLALDILGRIGDEAAVGPIRKLISHHPSDPNIRFTIYDTLGKLPIIRGAYLLASGMEDPDDTVAMAAVMAINNNLDDTLLLGLKNMINSACQEVERFAGLIVNAEADKVFLGLVNEDLFRKAAFNYLANEAHKDILIHFQELLQAHNLNQFAGAINPPSKEQAARQKKLIWAVDDSRLILRLYDAMLHNLDYDARVFESALHAWTELQHGQPDLLITDLNMPEMTGIELVEKVRQLYESKDLPILMVTTQQEDQDHQAAFKAGVNQLIAKPFKEEDLADALTVML